MPTYAKLRSATLADLPEIASLLEACSLPTSGLARIVDSFHVALCDGILVGCAAAVHLGQSIIIRSVAVQPAYRDRGIASRLVELLLIRAHGTEARHAFLLSASAPAYFARWGFFRVPIEAASPEVQAVADMQGAAPTMALCMRCELN